MKKSKIQLLMIGMLFILSFSKTFGKEDPFLITLPNTFDNCLENASLDSNKTVLYWKQIAPYVAVSKMCEKGRMLILYSAQLDLTVSNGSLTLSPIEMVPVQELTRKSAEIGMTVSVQKIQRYLFCISDTVKTFTVKNNSNESLPVNLDLEQFSASRNFGLFLDTDKEYLDIKAKAIENGENQRNRVMEAIKIEH